ncbi:MAG: serine/threonine protein kinase [Myxococcales bacterium]|nr:serine/threonine protein kinase [Myxococcales bacterium]
MARVYRGIHELLQREVAIKELLPEASKDKEALSRFRREALALAGFRHQNIVTLYDLVEKNGGLYMVMELVDGPTLSELLKDGPLPADVVAVIGAKLASALDHAHFNRIIHRDLKPSNVMLARSGEVKLTDFGIAKDEELDALTRQGMAIGTPSYMSPEQVIGGKLDPRTDLFSLGVVLYECMSGARPFVGANAGEIFARIRDGKHNRLSRIAPHVPREFRRIVGRAMKVRLSDRYQDAAGMRRDLEAHLSKEVRLSHSALLVAFLRHRKKISEVEAGERLSQKDLSISLSFDRPKARRALFWLWAGVLALGAALYVALAQPKWLEEVAKMLR